ncbi:hypothetical protein OF83DRAFT_1132833 [Amylostereum chailletii]|nr:hypothetical protein OF83DRAFT_1132833 [Amylostereum chailletii]
MSVPLDHAAAANALAPPPSSSFNVSFSLDFNPLINFADRVVSLLKYHGSRFGMRYMQPVSQDIALGEAPFLATRRERSPSFGLTPTPSPWAFFLSGYVLVLFVMTVLLTRVQHIAVPSRHRLHSHPPRLFSRRMLFLRPVYNLFLPIDTKSAFMRTLFRLPTLYYLLKYLGIWTTVLLQTSGSIPNIQWEWVKLIDHYVGHLEMEDICWRTYLSVCAACFTGAFMRGLDGGGTANNSPFNLFSYAFALHAYSFSMTHVVKPEGLPSRPDVHIILVMILPLAQLCMIHMMGIKRAWTNHRLLPTTVCSLLGLFHFSYVVLTYPARYPIINYTSAAFEATLALVIVVTFTLNALTQILLDGALTRPLVGHAAFISPRGDEDFSVVLLRVGIASLEATSIAGLGNELGGVPFAAPAAHQPSPYFGEVELNRSGIASLTQGAGPHGTLRGFANEVRTVKVANVNQDPWIQTVYLKELATFGKAVWKFLRGFGMMVWRFVRREQVFPHAKLPAKDRTTPESNIGSDVVEVIRRSGVAEEDDGTYRRFLAGDVLSDDDEDFVPREVSLPPDFDDEDFEDDDLASDAGSDDQDGPAAYTTLAATAMTTASAPVLLAHMSSPEAALTRRTYRQLSTPSEHHSPEDRTEPTWHDVVHARREDIARKLCSGEFGGEAADSRKACVICTVEERQIICWPCRCLALCEDCRENLASRTKPSKHTCPCCRRSVEGFSRIYIP